MKPDSAATAAIGFVALQYYTAETVPSCGSPSVRPFGQENKFGALLELPAGCEVPLLSPVNSPIVAGLPRGAFHGCCGLPRDRNRCRMSPQQPDPTLHPPAPSGSRRFYVSIRRFSLGSRFDESKAAQKESTRLNRNPGCPKITERSPAKPAWAGGRSLWLDAQGVVGCVAPCWSAPAVPVN